MTFTETNTASVPVSIPLRTPQEFFFFKDGMPILSGYVIGPFITGATVLNAGQSITKSCTFNGLSDYGVETIDNLAGTFEVAYGVRPT